MTDVQEVASFPVDDFTLDQLEHAMGTLISGWDDDGNQTYTGGDFTLSAFLNFMSGYDSAKLKPIDEYQEFRDIPIYDYPDPIFSKECVIRALIAEVRRLRNVPAGYEYETCNKCGGVTAPLLNGNEPVSWWNAPDELWERITGGPNGLLCIRCFTLKAKEQGVTIYWQAVEDTHG